MVTLEHLLNAILIDLIQNNNREQARSQAEARKSGLQHHMDLNAKTP